MKKLVLSLASALFAAGAAVAQLPDRIVCAGDYGGHLQGVATDGESIYWSFTVAVVKTDLAGKILASRKAPSHQGDLCYKDGVVYVAVNLGKFNTETRGVSQVTAYDAKTLEPLKTIPLPEMPHGAGGMTWKGDKFYIIGGLPLKHEKNYVYEYTSDFTFVKRHDLDTGFTWMGIQTAAHEDNAFYFGIYGSKGDPSGVLACPDDLSSYTRYTGAGSVGIIKLDGAYYLGGTGRDKATKRNTGHLVRQKAFPDPKKAFSLAPTGKGWLRIFFEGRDTSGWKDAGYVFNNDGNKPIFSQDALFVSAKAAAACKEFPAVGIGGGKEFYTPDLVRGVHRAALHREVFSLHLPGTPDSLKGDAALAAAVEAVTREAGRLGVTVIGQ
ncbi:MAG: hypothetical protein IJL17_15705 [Kiritimatiellae bacterium]|nr:hypothetical protein [Kiritimatiellia bacterium]